MPSHPDDPKAQQGKWNAAHPVRQPSHQARPDPESPTGSLSQLETSRSRKIEAKVREAAICEPRPIPLSDSLYSALRSAECSVGTIFSRTLGKKLRRCP